MFSLDANILFYAADKNAGGRHNMAQQLVHDAAQAKAALTEQALIEFFHAATRKGRVPIPDATSIVRDLADNFTVLFPHAELIEDTLALFLEHRLSIWDARMLAICAVHGCNHLLSEDLQDGAMYDTVRVVDPFQSKNALLIGELLAS